MEFDINNLEDMKAAARQLLNFSIGKAEINSKATILGLYGNLGAGKTTFTQFIAKELGIKENITSPTFVIQKSYAINPAVRSIYRKLVHIDAYRLKNGQELSVLGWQKTISEPNTLICIEWPENVADVMPSHIKIQFEHVEEGKRRIVVQ
ncbi:MAG: tRNA (adenosine(37)-N6)-threonylcarbamoyltransferase complex ATPase subunit type 1 TsaE [Patescibacteria group bacterium]